MPRTVHQVRREILEAERLWIELEAGIRAAQRCVREIESSLRLLRIELAARRFAGPPATCGEDDGAA
jgi:hypothetical protein